MPAQCALPITLYEFSWALETAGRAKTQWPQPRLIALAVSGGVDSMALASLCAALKQQTSGRMKFRALIVDHQARHGNSADAHATARTLNKLGMPTTRMKLDWGEIAAPCQLPGFETHARKLRYRALARACRYHRIACLLLGHHSDDQAETVLLRLINHYIGNGLCGMKAISGVPECHGVYGIPTSANTISMDEIVKVARHERHVQTAVLKAAPSGITVCRPLLEFDKERLKATCVQLKTPWIEDITNVDTTFTVRNSIRYLFLDKRLPVALEKDSLLALCKRITKRVNICNRQANAAIRGLAYMRLDMRSGKLVLHLPANLGDWQLYAESGDRLEHLKIEVVQKLARLVSPLGDLNRRRLSQPTRLIFADGQKDKAVSRSVTAAGLHWVVMLSCSGIGLDGKVVRKLTITRQPYMATDVQPRCIWSREAEVSGEFNGERSSKPFTAWQLFDGRFWMRISKASSRHIVARPLCEADMKDFRAGLSISTRKQLDESLSNAAPDKSRWTLPAFAESHDGPVIALPSLGFKLQILEEVLQWQIQYKALNIDEL